MPSNNPQKQRKRHNSAITDVTSLPSLDDGMIEGHGVDNTDSSPDFQGQQQTIQNHDQNGNAPPQSQEKSPDSTRPNHPQQLPLPPTQVPNDANDPHDGRQFHQHFTTGGDDSWLLPGSDDFMLDPNFLTTFHDYLSGSGVHDGTGDEAAGLDLDELMLSTDTSATDMLSDFLLPSPPFDTAVYMRQENSLLYPSMEDQRQCGCLGMTVKLLEDLDSLLFSQIAYAALDSSLAAHRTCLSQARRILCCEECNPRLEHVALLTHVAEKLARLCERIVFTFLETANQPSLSSSFFLSHISFSPTAEDAIQSYNNVSQPRLTRITPSSSSASSASSSLSSSADSVDLPFYCGSYDADASERECVLRLLISLQLRALHAFLAGLKRPTSLQQVSRLESIDARIQSAINRLRSSTKGGKIRI